MSSNYSDSFNQKNIRISLLIPCRNEKGTICTAIDLGTKLPGVDEIFVIEGNSTDGTYETAVEFSLKLQKDRNCTIKVIKQSKTGKWNAVQEGIMLTSNEYVSIWDADLTVSFSEQCLIHENFVSNFQKFNVPCLSTGNRMSSREPGSMRILNFLGNSFFSKIWSLISGQHIPDLLCGSKVFSKYILETISKSLFQKDPYGDFVIFAAALNNGQKIEFQNLTYRPRIYGQTNILRWSGGIQLLIFTLYYIRENKIR